MEAEKKKVAASEPEWTGSMWKHPYMLYILLTVVRFAFLLVMGWLAWTQGWIPNRGTSA
ncbi:hypothetical protein WDW37_18415 [Bdellovibrionota bacterium FG-1]